MTAQQQLAELNAIDGSWSDATEAKAAGWVDKHGRVIASLLNEHGDWSSTLGQLVIALMQDDLALAKDIARGIRVEFKTDGSPRAESESLRKLTQDA